MMKKIISMVILFLGISFNCFAADILNMPCVNCGFRDDQYIGVVEKSVFSDNFVARVMFKADSSSEYLTFRSENLTVMPNNPKDVSDLNKMKNAYPSTFTGYYFISSDKSTSKSVRNAKRPYKYAYFADIGTYEIENMKYDGAGPYLLLTTRKNLQKEFKESKPSLSFDDLLSLVPDVNDEIAPLLENPEYSVTNTINSYSIKLPYSREFIVLSVVAVPNSTTNSELKTVRHTYVFVKKLDVKKLFKVSDMDSTSLISVLDLMDNNHLQLLFKSENEQQVTYTMININNMDLKNFTYEKF